MTTLAIALIALILNRVGRDRLRAMHDQHRLPGRAGHHLLDLLRQRELYDGV